MKLRYRSTERTQDLWRLSVCLYRFNGFRNGKVFSSSSQVIYELNETVFRFEFIWCSFIASKSDVIWLFVPLYHGMRTKMSQVPNGLNLIKKFEVWSSIWTFFNDSFSLNVIHLIPISISFRTSASLYNPIK